MRRRLRRLMAISWLLVGLCSVDASFRAYADGEATPSPASTPATGAPQAPAPAIPTGPRMALVIAQSDYVGAPYPRAQSDAALIANNLQEAGFSVESGADLPEYGISERIKAFVDHAAVAGKDGTALIYVSGRFAQLNGENILLPVSTKVISASDAALSGYGTRKLISVLQTAGLKQTVVVFDAGPSIASLTTEKSYVAGLASIEPPDGFLIALSQNPGVPIVETSDKSGPFARAFLEALQQPINSMTEFFRTIRVRVYEETGGIQRTWEASKLSGDSFAFFSPENGGITPSAITPLADTKVQAEMFNVKFSDETIKTLPRDQAYKKTIALNTIPAYQEFITAYPDDDAIPSMQYNLAVSREAEVWEHARSLDTPDAYWTYETIYPDGGNMTMARSRLDQFGRPQVPPADFHPVEFHDIPAPLPKGEIVASSASMPIEFVPRAPHLSIPPAPLAIAAAAMAVPVIKYGVDRTLPRLEAASVRPKWAAPPASSPAIVPLNSTLSGNSNYPVTTGGVAASGVPISPGSAKPVTGAVSPGIDRLHPMQPAQPAMAPLAQPSAIRPLAAEPVAGTRLLQESGSAGLKPGTNLSGAPASANTGQRAPTPAQSVGSVRPLQTSGSAAAASPQTAPLKPLTPEPAAPFKPLQEGTASAPPKFDAGSLTRTPAQIAPAANGIQSAQQPQMQQQPFHQNQFQPQAAPAQQRNPVQQQFQPMQQQRMMPQQAPQQRCFIRPGTRQQVCQ